MWAAISVAAKARWGKERGVKKYVPISNNKGHSRLSGLLFQRPQSCAELDLRLAPSSIISMNSGVQPAATPVRWLTPMRRATADTWRRTRHRTVKWQWRTAPANFDQALILTNMLRILHRRCRLIPLT